MLIGLFIYSWEVVCSNHGFFWGLCGACLLVLSLCDPLPGILCLWFCCVVFCWSLTMGERINYSWMHGLRENLCMSAWRSLIPHLVINPSTMPARTSSSLWVLLPNFSPCRWTQRWWWSSPSCRSNQSVDHDLKSLNSQQKAESVTVVVGLNRRECR